MSNPQTQNAAGGNGLGAGASGSTGDLKSSVDTIAQQAKEQGQERIDSARQTTADTLEKLAEGVRGAASQLEGDGTVANLSGYIVQMAEGMTKAASGLREKSGDDLVREVTRLARENPTVFVAGAVALGFGLTRFARASSSRVADTGAAMGTGSDLVPTGTTSATSDASLTSGSATLSTGAPIGTSTASSGGTGLSGSATGSGGSSSLSGTGSDLSGSGVSASSGISSSTGTGSAGLSGGGSGGGSTGLSGSGLSGSAGAGLSEGGMGTSGTGSEGGLSAQGSSTSGTGTGTGSTSASGTSGTGGSTP